VVLYVALSGFNEDVLPSDLETSFVLSGPQEGHDFDGAAVRVDGGRFGWAFVGFFVFLSGVFQEREAANHLDLDGVDLKRWVSSAHPVDDLGARVLLHGKLGLDSQHT